MKSITLTIICVLLGTFTHIAYAQSSSDSRIAKMSELQNLMESAVNAENYQAYAKHERELRSLYTSKAAQNKTSIVDLNGKSPEQIKQHFESQYQNIQAFSKDDLVGRTLPEASVQRIVKVSDTTIKVYWLIAENRMPELFPELYQKEKEEQNQGKE